MLRDTTNESSEDIFWIWSAINLTQETNTFLRQLGTDKIFTFFITIKL